MILSGRRYLVTGGASGIGLQTVKDLVKAGAKVLIVDYNEKKLSKVLEDLPQGNVGLVCDLRYPLQEVEKIFSYIGENHIVLDGLVYCAGIAPLMTVADNDCNIMKDAFAVNVFSFVECVKHMLVDGVCQHKGSIVAISSIAASQSTNRQTVYAGSKAALEAAIRCMAKELMLRGIRVNGLALGAVRTEMFKELETMNPDLGSRYPLGAIPMEQVSTMILYLLSDESDHMTGSVVKIDGGHDAWLK